MSGVEPEGFDLVAAVLGLALYFVACQDAAFLLTFGPASGQASDQASVQAFVQAFVQTSVRAFVPAFAQTDVVVARPCCLRPSFPTAAVVVPGPGAASRIGVAPPVGGSADSATTEQTAPGIGLQHWD